MESSLSKMKILAFFFILFFIVSVFHLLGNNIKSHDIWQGVYYAHGLLENERYGPVFKL